MSGWLHPYTPDNDSNSSGKQEGATENDGIEGMDNDEATLERERTRLQLALQKLDLRVVIESVQRGPTHDDLVLSKHAADIQQRIQDVVLNRENPLQYSLVEVQVRRTRPNWPKAQMPLSWALAIRRAPLKRTRYPLPLFLLGKVALALLAAYLLYFLVRLHLFK